MINSKLLGIGFMCAMALTLSAEAKLYKWVDDNYSIISPIIDILIFYLFI